tara:strand:- start:7534 stop:7839 length:306 start_codon:yes stop_codon:yes gene_type:complete
MTPPEEGENLMSVKVCNSSQVARRDKSEHRIQSIDDRLRAAFDATLLEPVPPKMRDLLDRIVDKAGGAQIIEIQTERENGGDRRAGHQRDSGSYLGSVSAS